MLSSHTSSCTSISLNSRIGTGSLIPPSVHLYLICLLSVSKNFKFFLFASLHQRAPPWLCPPQRYRVWMTLCLMTGWTKVSWKIAWGQRPKFLSLLVILLLTVTGEMIYTCRHTDTSIARFSPYWQDANLHLLYIQPQTGSGLTRNNTLVSFGI